ncbi:MAG: septal ring lytic transglycosylase RlpA family protein [Sphingobacteriaceae bacterium]|jgi:rare lipoprotein A|nr:septal ring lytic transglycosylase RlpA family protein [Sphingobacteriaceae bacterium]
MKFFLFLIFFSITLNAQEIVPVNQTDTIYKTIYTTYYAKKFEGRKTTSGERYRAAKFTAAHRTLPFGTMIKVKNIRTGKTIEVRVNDRGPFSKKFSLDLSQVAAKALGIYKLGYAKVEIAYVLPKK